MTRDEWKSILYKQVTERRASERKAIEEVTKLDNEEFSPMESEAELTDEESLVSCENGETEKVNEEPEVSKQSAEEKGCEEDEDQLDCLSDSDGSSSDDDSVEGDGEDSDEDELVVRNKKSTKHLHSDSDSETPSQPSTNLPTTPVVRNFPIDKEMTTATSQMNDLSNNTKLTKETEDRDKKAIDSGLGTSLLNGVSSDVDNSTLDSNTSIVDNVPLMETVTPKRPSKDDTNIASIYYLLIQCFVI